MLEQYKSEFVSEHNIRLEGVTPVEVYDAAKRFALYALSKNPPAAGEAFGLEDYIHSGIDRISEIKGNSRVIDKSELDEVE